MKDIPVIKLTNQGSTDELGRDFQNLVGPGPVRDFFKCFSDIGPWIPETITYEPKLSFFHRSGAIHSLSQPTITP